MSLTGVVNAAYSTLLSNLQVNVFKLVFDFKVLAYIFLDLLCMIKGVVSWGDIQNYYLFKVDVVFCPGQKLLNLFG